MKNYFKEVKLIPLLIECISHLPAMALGILTSIIICNSDTPLFNQLVGVDILLLIGLFLPLVIKLIKSK